MNEERKREQDGYREIDGERERERERVLLLLTECVWSWEQP